MKLINKIKYHLYYRFDYRIHKKYYLNYLYLHYIYNPIFEYYHLNFRLDIYKGAGIKFFGKPKWENSIIKMLRIILVNKLVSLKG